MTATRRFTARLSCEPLESRELLSASPITYHKGDLQRSVQVEAIYYGPSWTGSLAGEQAVINSGLKTALGDAYLDTPSEAGYGGFGGSLAGSTVAVNGAAADNNVVTPAEVQAYLDNALHHPYTADQKTDRILANRADRLYLVFVDPDYVVKDLFGHSSTDSVLGYHTFFRETLGGKQQIVHFAVVAAPGGAAGNPSIANAISPLTDTLTGTASRELLDAMSDPDGFGWYANDSLKEIGDSGSYVYLNQTLVARPQTPDFYRMTPAPATAGCDPALGTSAANAPTFLLDANGGLWEAVRQPGADGKVTTVTTQVASNVASVSDQGIDNSGRATVGYVTADGKSFEYHDGGPVQLLYSPVAADESPVAAKKGVTALGAKAGQGASYVLLSNHQAWEYDEQTHVVSLREVGVAAIDAGTTAQGVNMVDVIDTKAVAWEVPDRGAEHSLGLTDVTQVSAGRQGVSALLRSNHSARLYDDAAGGLVGPSRLNVARVASGFSADGNYVLDLLFQSTRLAYEADYVRNASGQLVSRVERNGPRTGALSLGKMRAGVIDLVFADGAYEGKIDGKQTFFGAFVAAV
jgi:hypothetical protein